MLEFPKLLRATKPPDTSYYLAYAPPTHHALTVTSNVQQRHVKSQFGRRPAPRCAVTRAAKAAGLTTFTIQHGFENIGLTYADDRYGLEVSFASEHIFIWGPASGLPAWVSPQTRRRVISVGLTKPVPQPESLVLPSASNWARTIGIFENLHWERFSPRYRDGFSDQLAEIVRQFPDVLFVVKPHHAGRWLIDNPDFVPAAANLLLIDPRDPAWQRHTAPALLPALDAAITTPSTVAIDAAKAGRPVAVVANDLALPIYEPLPLLRRTDDWRRFLDGLAQPETWLHANEVFLRRNFLAGPGERRIAQLLRRLAKRGKEAPDCVADPCHAPQPNPEPTQPEA
ncbi:MAG: hypothetical protein ACM3JG_16965 [Thiohalocapsa sp.]